MDAVKARKHAIDRQKPKNTKTLYEQNAERLKEQMLARTVQNGLAHSLGLKHTYY